MAGQLIVPALIAAGLIAWSRRRGSVNGKAIAESNRPKAELLFCLLTAASASLPIAISPKQSGHYAFPSYSLYALALAMWCAAAVIALFGAATERSTAAAVRSRAHRWLRGLAVAGSATVLLATCFLAGRPHRDKDMYHDTLVIGHLVPRQTARSASPRNSPTIIQFRCIWPAGTESWRITAPRRVNSASRRSTRFRPPAIRRFPPICAATGYSSAPTQRRSASALAISRRAIETRDVGKFRFQT